MKAVFIFSPNKIFILSLSQSYLKFKKISGKNVIIFSGFCNRFFI